jgi:hypothetical protein
VLFVGVGAGRHDRGRVVVEQRGLGMAGLAHIGAAVGVAGELSVGQFQDVCAFGDESLSVRRGWWSVTAESVIALLLVLPIGSEEDRVPPDKASGTR